MRILCFSRKGASRQWVKQLVHRGELEGVETSLGWLIEPSSVERLATKRLEKAEKKVSALKTASTWTKKNSATGSSRGRAAHGKALHAKSKGSRYK